MDSFNEDELQANRKLDDCVRQEFNSSIFLLLKLTPHDT